MNLKGLAAVLLVLGLGLLVAPAGGCGSVVRAWTASPRALPADTPPQLDEAEVARDAEAVRVAQAALVAWHPTGPRASAQPSPRTTTKRVTVSRVDAQEVAAAERAVSSSQDHVDADQAELDRLLAEQEASSDPASYDDQVAAAREELERSVAALDEANSDLRTARSRTASVLVTTTASPRPAPVAKTPQQGGDRAALSAQVADARQLQQAHLAARSKTVADWRTAYQAEASKVGAHNAEVRSCARRAAVPGSAGVALLLLGGGALAWRPVRRVVRASAWRDRLRL